MQDPIFSTVISFANFTFGLCHGSIMCNNSTCIRRKQFFIQYFCGADRSYYSVLFYSIMNLTMFGKGISQFRPSFFYFLIYEKIFKMLESGGRNKNKNKNSKIEESKKKKKKKKKSLITFFFF